MLSLCHRWILGSIVTIATGCTTSGSVLEMFDLGPPDMAQAPPMPDGGAMQMAPPHHGFCGPTGWCWQDPMPQGTGLGGVWVSPGGEAWAVGGGGTILRIQGSTPTLIESPTTLGLFGISGTGPTDV